MREGGPERSGTDTMLLATPGGRNKETQLCHCPQRAQPAHWWQTALVKDSHRTQVPLPTALKANA